MISADKIVASVALACVFVVGLMFACSAKAAKQGTNIQIVGTDTFCESYTTITASGITTLTCVPTGSGGSGAPNGCGATVNFAAIANLTSAGGAVSLNSSCSIPSSGVTYNWSRNGILGAATVASWTDTLPANSTTNTVSYTYQVRACVNTACTTFPATPLQVNVAGTSGGSWSGTCPGYANTVVLQMNWANPVRLYTGAGFANTDVAVVQFTTGNVSSTSSLPRIAAAEFDSPPSSRTAVLSLTPCDFGVQSAPGATSGPSNSTQNVFALGTGTGFGYYPILQLNRTYFLNIKNNASTCTTACQMFIDLVKPGGL